MKGQNFANIGMLIFIILYMIDRFIIKVSDPVYIAIMIVSIIFLVSGIWKMKKEKA